MAAPTSIPGRYELLGEIGKGSMGTVYHAHDSILDRDVAIKMMRTGPHVEPEIKERFYREARACARLQHPNIVTVYDLGESEGSAYIAMELLTGMDWRAAVRERHRFPLKGRIEFMAQVCDGLAHAHRSSVVHRDIKPSNLFIQENGQSKILDFGLARLPESSLTLAGRVLGTPNYMAPEQILGRACDRRSDLFSAAIVFFEFLTGVHPFQSPFIPRRIADGDPASLGELSGRLPVSLHLIFDRSLAKEPDLRYENAEQLAADLRTAAGEISEDDARAPVTQSEPENAGGAATGSKTITYVRPGDDTDPNRPW
jgi:serine/threonine protein kinase